MSRKRLPVNPVPRFRAELAVPQAYTAAAPESRGFETNIGFCRNSRPFFASFQHRSNRKLTDNQYRQLAAVQAPGGWFQIQVQIGIFSRKSEAPHHTIFPRSALLSLSFPQSGCRCRPNRMDTQLSEHLSHILAHDCVIICDNDSQPWGKFSFL